MTVETALYPPQLNTALPTAGDMVSEGDDHIRLTKTVVKTTFPNVAGAVSASHIELSYLAGATASIQNQINAKSNRAGETYSGTHNYSGAAIKVPTMAPGTNTTDAASTAFVLAQAFSAALPSQSGNAGRYIKSDGTNASWQPAVASLNGESGALTKTTLAAYGITNWSADVDFAAGVNLRLALLSGVYRISTAIDAPVGVQSSGVLVMRSGDTCSQILVDQLTGMMFVRSGVIFNGQLCLSTNFGVPPPWRAMVSSCDVPRAVPSNNFDPTRATYWSDDVSSNKTYTFSPPEGAFPCFTLEITHTGGAINFGSVIWENGTAPVLTTFRRHLFFFQLAASRNAWFGYYHGNYSI